MYRVIRATTDTWVGDKPWNDDKFEYNANRLGLEIYEKDVPKSLGEYVVLDHDTIFYHATKPEYVDSILSQGLKCQNHKGMQANGVYLTGGSNDLDTWFGKDTVVLEVRVPAGTEVYRDFQPNAVFVRIDIQSRNIQLISE